MAIAELGQQTASGIERSGVAHSVAPFTDKPINVSL